MVEGQAAIQTAIHKMVEAGIQALDLQAVDVIEAGDFVIEIGRTTVTIQPPGVMSQILLAYGEKKIDKTRQVHCRVVPTERWRTQDRGRHV